MKTKKFVFALAVICLSFLVASPAMAGQASAKFAATWGSARPNVVSVADTEGYVAEDTVVFDANMGYTLTTIKVPQDKELLVGLSAEIGLVTDTSIKGREGGAAKALAGGAGHMIIAAIPVDGNGSFAIAKPGGVVLSSRFQELDATLGGVIQSAEDTGTWSVVDGECVETTYESCDPNVGEGDVSCPDGQITVPCEFVFTDEEIGLTIKTLAAHHFNFVLPDMDQGVYKIVAFFTTSAVAAVDICEEGEECNYDPDGTVQAAAYAKAFVGKHMLTVQQVRAVNGSLEDTDIIEP